jgi:hypothetical protein
MGEQNMAFEEKHIRRHLHQPYGFVFFMVLLGVLVNLDYCNVIKFPLPNWLYKQLCIFAAPKTVDFGRIVWACIFAVFIVPVICAVILTLISFLIFYVNQKRKNAHEKLKQICKEFWEKTKGRFAEK